MPIFAAGLKIFGIARFSDVRPIHISNYIIIVSMSLNFEAPSVVWRDYGLIDFLWFSRDMVFPLQSYPWVTLHCGEYCGISKVKGLDAGKTRNVGRNGYNPRLKICSKNIQFF